jgi:hypothetical protein
MWELVMVVVVGELLHGEGRVFFLSDGTGDVVEMRWWW